MNPLKSLSRSQRKRLNSQQRPNLVQSLTGLRLQLVSIPALGLIAGLTLLGEAPAYGQAAGDIQVRTEFTPILINQGGTASLRLTIRNNAVTTLDNVQLNQVLPAGLRLGGTAATTNSCNFALNLATNTTLGITNGTLPAFAGGQPGLCILEVPVVGTRTQATAGDRQVTLTIPAGGFQAGTGANTAESSGIITVRQLGNIAHSMTFAPTPIPGGGRTRFTMNIPNGTGQALTNATFTNGFTIPAGFTLAAGTLNNTCGGALSITGNPLQVRLTGGTIPAAGCEFSFEMIGPVIENTYGPVTWAAGDLVTDLEVSNNAGTSNTLAVEAGLKITQNFNLASVYINEPSTLTINIRNASATAIADADLQSIITGATSNQLRVVPGTLGGTCTPATVNYTAATGTLAFTGVDLPAATLTPAANARIEECTITVQVDSNNQGIGTYTSTIANGQLANQTGPSATNLQIIDLETGGGPGVGLGFAFGPGVGGPFGSHEVAASNRGLMRITLNNNAGEDLTGVGISGTGIQLDAGMRLAATGTVSNTCGGTVTAPAGPGPITLTGGAIPRRGSCYIDVRVVSDTSKLASGYGASAAAGVVSTDDVNGQVGRNYINAAAGPGPNYLEVTDYLNILPSMETTTTAPNADARVRLRLTNARDQARSQLQLRYRLPFRIAGVPDFEAGPGCDIADPATAFRVVADASAPSGFSLELDNISIPAKGTNTTLLGNGQDGICDLAFDVQAPAANGTATVPVPAGTLRTIDGSDQNRTDRNTTFNVVPLNLDLSQTIVNEDIDPGEAVDLIRGGEPAILIVTLNNPGNPVPLTNITFSDALENARARIYPGAVATTTCTGNGGIPATVTLNETTRTFGLTGANLNSGQSCTLRVPVTTLAVDLLPNTIAAEAAVSAEGAKSNADTDQIQVSANLGLVKTIVPGTVAAGDSARMTITILNATNTAPTDVTLTDDFPVGLVMADTPDLQTAGCAAASVSAPAGANVLRVRNGSIAANNTCTISVNVTSLVPQGAPGYVNTIPAGRLSSEGGVRTNPKAASASLLVTGTTVSRPGLRLVKRATALTVPANPATGTVAAAIDLSTISVDDNGSFDNAPGWPAPINATSGISSYLRGATDTAQLTLPGQQSLKSGTEVEYSGYYLSNGTVGTANTQLCDFIPANTTYQPGSLVWVNGAGVETPVLDATGFLPATTTAFPNACRGDNNNKGAVILNLGNLTNTGTGSYGYFKFKVTID